MPESVNQLDKLVKSFDTFQIQPQFQFQSQTGTLSTKYCQRPSLRLKLRLNLKFQNRMDKLVGYSLNKNKMMNFFFWAFMIWSFPMSYYRSRFRKIVYQTEDWTINIKPIFKEEMKGLFGNLYPDNADYIKMRNFYRFYLVVYFVLFLLWYF